MDEFAKSLAKTGEVGIVSEVQSSVVYVKGLPDVKFNEMIVFENDTYGEVLSLSRDYVEVLLLGQGKLSVGTRAARTGDILQMPVGDRLIGKIISPLGGPWGSEGAVTQYDQVRPIDTAPSGIKERKSIDQPLETGVAVVDLLLPLGRGQRELILGDRKTGRTAFVLQIMQMHAMRGELTIYAAIGKSSVDIKRVIAFIKEHGIEKNVIVVASSSADPSGLIYLTPYSAMVMAEYFRDQDKDVLLILDDMSTHAKYYREVSLLAKRFPGRASYPGDIFYIHSKLLERAGNYQKGSITCLPVADAVLGDISGYIQTNLMAITDGHLFFDNELFDQGRRPAINPFLSVTRVGRQAQTPLQRDISSELSSFIVAYDKLLQYTHYGAEVSEETRQTIAMGDKIIALLQQSTDEVMPVNVNSYIVILLFAGRWKTERVEEMEKETAQMAQNYLVNAQYRKKIDDFITSGQTMREFIERIKREGFPDISVNSK